MNICFYAPFKPLGHPNPSGDLIIATGLYGYFKNRGHKVWPVSDLRARWIYWKPWQWPKILKELRRIMRGTGWDQPDLWLTYHTYYKAPDLLGPFAARYKKLPYVIFQGIFSTKRKRDWRTWPGYILNKRALFAARHVFTNRREDFVNLKRIIPSQRVTYVAPGIYPETFYFDPAARAELRRTWDVGDDPVVLSAAMFRPGVKAEGIAWVIRSCGHLMQKGVRFHLVIAGDGKEKASLERLADTLLPGRFRFVGKINRDMMHRFYSAGDMFVFPGIRETLGMVYLEAQSCGLPVIAFENGGIPEVVKNGETGFLLPLHEVNPFVDAMERLIVHVGLRRKMGAAASAYLRSHHDLNRNYRKVEDILTAIIK